MKKILFMGFPGAGKGTQAKLMEVEGIIHISTGDVIRKSTEPEMVKYRKEGYARGDLLSDELIFKIVKDELDNLPKNCKGYILDGAVRTLAQAEYVKEKSLIETVVFFELTKGVAMKRLLNRNEGRADDNLEAVQHRFDEYKNKTKPVIDFLKKNFEFHTISAEPPVDEIHKEVLKALCIK